VAPEDTLPDAGFSPAVTWDDGDAVASLTWPSIRGKRYHVQRSTGLDTWNTLAGIYAFGTTTTLRVQESPPAPGAGDPPVVFPRSFVITVFDNGRELLNIPGGRSVLFEENRIGGEIPGVLAASVPGGAGEPPTPVVALSVSRAWDEALALDPQLTEASLDAADAALKDLFLAALAIHQLGGGGGSGDVFGAAGAGGPGVFYRIGVEEPDTDRDGLPDWREFAEITDPWNPDTDGEGVSDGDEDHYGSDPNNPDDSPQPNPESPASKDFYNQYQYGPIVNYNHDEERADNNNPPRPVEDVVKWKGTDDGMDNFGVRKRKLQPIWEDWNVDVENENPVDLTRLRVTIPEGLEEGNTAFLKVKPTRPEDAQAFHLYAAHYGAGGDVSAYVPLWGGFEANRAAGEDAGATIGTEVDLGAFLFQNGFGGSATLPPGGTFDLFLEGTIFRGMPFPAADGFARYDGQSAIFDGAVEIGRSGPCMAGRRSGLLQS